MNVERKWLVKSSDTIHGPFEFDRIVENIFTGEIHLLDEIKGPFERWRPIKDHSLFAAAIEKLKASTYEPRENTMTATVDIHTQTELTHTDTVSVTDRVLPLDSDETPTSENDDKISDHTVVYQPKTNNNSNTPESKQPQIPDSAPAPPPKMTVPPPAWTPPAKADQKGRFPAIFLASFLVMVIGGASYLVYEFKQTKLKENNYSAYDQFTDNAIDFLKIGEYQKALNSFTMAYKLSSTDPNLLIEMSPLSVQFDGQFSEVEMRLENMLATRRQKTIVKIARNIVGLSYSYRSMFGEALASYEASLQIDDQFLPALLNKSFILIKLKKYESAVKLMRQVVADNPENPAAHYFYIRSLVEQGMAQSNKNILKEALSVADQFSQKFFDFKQEVSFLMAVSHYHLGSPESKILSSVNDFLQVDMELTNLHVHDTLIDFQSFNWRDYIPMCDKLRSALNDYSKKMLEGFCLLKVHRTIEAKKVFESLLIQKSNDGLLQALYASSLLKLNDISQAKNALGFLNQMDFKKSVVETILRGCLMAKEKDLKCAHAIFQGQHFKHMSLLYSWWGNSEIEIGTDRRKAKSFLMRGLNKSPNFAPYLKLRKKL